LGGLANEEQFPLVHQHMYFGYAFQNQVGWKELLGRFVAGGGKLLDLEYLVDDNNQRLVTFATIAGYIGYAIFPP
jgi:saccharopine dehydrogenase (NAD+, L-lysine-forming)